MLKRRIPVKVSLDNLDQNYWSRIPKTQSENIRICNQMTADNELFTHPLMDKLSFMNNWNVEALMYGLTQDESPEENMAKLHVILEQQGMYSDASIEEWIEFTRLIDTVGFSQDYDSVMNAYQSATQFLNEHVFVLYEMAEQRSNLIRDELAAVTATRNY
jgi:hypothetical protein